MEVKNYLLGYKDMYIYQDTDMFSFSLDSVLLPNFITINKGITNILDIGTGNAPIPLILSTKTDASITIVGSTSPEGSEKFNRNLALARANAVKDALVKAGVDKDRITVTNAYGKQRNATIILSK